MNYRASARVFLRTVVWKCEYFGNARGKKASRGFCSLMFSRHILFILTSLMKEINLNVSDVLGKEHRNTQGKQCKQTMKPKPFQPRL